MAQSILTSDAVKTIEIVEFKVGKKILGVTIDAVQEIIHSTPVTSIPLAHPFIKGMAAVRGDVLNVLNLEEVIDETSHFNAKQEKMIVLQCLNYHFVIHVDEVTEIKIVNKEDFRISQASYMQYEIETDQGLLYILDLEEILNVIQSDRGIR
ncbi:chemotaxis signal transduction protein [Bacillus oleivorans]|uniref:Chemotaxis signal transduction protein n=1 Tax=Bacillus oleivorans TaxID=1448271 RepID=A0A285D275_9BACI|nr:chemotaxis protein CheW [Bacillus oleivorans]SNX73911.1 chemotaxis signal transduction protein [Bacillus oleivorans]